MNSKRVNWLFLCFVLLNVILSAAAAIAYRCFGYIIDIPIVANFVLSQLMIMVPALLFMTASKRGTMTGSMNEMLGFRKIKISSFFMIILFTFLIMPMTSVLNAISMLFVKNTVNVISGNVLQMPFIVMLFLIGIFGPFCEEFVFRGVIFHGYKNSGPVFWSVFWSALIFGLIHLNFNQAAYTIAIGIMLALLVEATGSVWSSVIAHMIINSQQVCLMYMQKIDMREIQIDMREIQIGIIGVCLAAAAVATPLAFCVLFWLAGNEKREMQWKNIWAYRKEKRDAFASIPLIIAIVISLAYMTLWEMNVL